jgi:AraC-like DNA-binding protein
MDEKSILLRHSVKHSMAELAFHLLLTKTCHKFNTIVGGNKMEGKVNDVQNDLTESFQSITNKQDMLAKVIEYFPYPIQVFSIDGTARIINKAAVDMLGIKTMESHVGKYNVFKDPFVHALGAADQIRQVLKGKTVHLTDFSASYQYMIKHYNAVDCDIQTLISDITCFPLVKPDGSVECFVAVFINNKIYKMKEEISHGKRYIETHWQEPYDADKTAKAACLSKTHFTKLFKKHTGLTPHEYYNNYRISKLKEKLLDSNLTITQAFAACNIDYNGRFAKMFKEKVGVTPSVYKKMTYSEE